MGAAKGIYALAMLLLSAYYGAAGAACCRNYTEYAAWCRDSGGIPGTNPLRCSPPAQADPRIGQASALNEQGRREMERKDYDKAAYYFAQASGTYADPVYRDNHNLALSAKHVALGNRAFGESKWDLAVAEYERALTFREDAGARDNIRAARYNQATGFAAEALSRRAYDQAILYYNEAKRWAKDPAKLDEWIRQAQASKAFAQGQAAYEAGNFAQAEAHYAEALRLNPRNKAAASNRALAVRVQGDVLAKAGSLDAAIAQYDRALRAYLDAKALLGDAAGLGPDLAKARANIRAWLAHAAKSPADWNRVVAAHQRWYEASGGELAAKRELDNARAQQAGKLATSATTRDQLSGSVSTLDDLVRQNPGNETAVLNRNRAVEALSRADRAGDYLRQVSGSALNRALAMQQARNVQRYEDCFDGRNCRNAGGQDPDVVVPDGRPFYAAQENERMRAIHTELVTLEKKRDEMVNALPAISDSMVRATRKQEIANIERRVVEQKAAYKEEERQETVRHGLERRKPAAGGEAGAN